LNFQKDLRRRIDINNKTNSNEFISTVVVFDTAVFLVVVVVVVFDIFTVK